jgi:dCMP deaminase
MNNGRRIGRNELWVELAKLYARRSTCPRANVGCVLVRDRRALAAGYNGAPPGLPHCTEEGYSCVLNEDGCKRAIHAEANAVAWAARTGIEVVGSTLFTTHEPCLPCSQLLISAGIVAVYWQHDYERNSGQTILRDAGVEILGRF